MPFLPAPSVLRLALPRPAHTFALALPAPRDNECVLELGRTLDPLVWRFRVRQPGTPGSAVVYRVL